MKDIKAYFRPVTALSLAVMLAGCAGGAYKQGNWVNSGVESDWDIDSAVCLQHAENLTQDDLDEINRIKQESKKVASVAGQVASGLGDYDDSGILSYLSATTGMFGGARSSSAEETVKEKKFSACLEDKGWAN